MFYCDECREKRKWPESMHKSYGKCELCGKTSMCNDVPSKDLPTSDNNIGRGRGQG